MFDKQNLYQTMTGKDFVEIEPAIFEQIKNLISIINCFVKVMMTMLNKFKTILNKDTNIIKVENRILSKFKTGHNYLELLRTETMKVLRSTEKKLTKDKNGENVTHLEINEIV